MSKNNTGCLLAILFLALCGSMLGNLILFGLLTVSGAAPAPASLRPVAPKAFQEETIVMGTGTKIAVIPLEGLISFGISGHGGDSMVEEFQRGLQQAARDPQVAAIVISVDSPGGEITASDVIYESIKDFPSDKPVVVFMNAIGTSGAYYAACGADWIMCNPTTFTGSIGVIISTINYQDLFGKIGLQSVVFKSGKFKDMLSGAREISPEEEAYVQGLVMQSYDRFLGIVAEQRNLNPTQLRSGAGDGRIMSGIDAKEAGLVDQTGYIAEAYAKAMDLAGVEHASVVRYRPIFRLASFFRLFGESAASAKEIRLLPETFRLEPGRLYLLPPTFAP